ncbi:CHAP domain-containing protein [Nocardioides sp. GXQ0305]|uniref:CHAP domain-containing protein n=1 Tax=Nocardioides sp. GXQ0305 TaxID=3423912 RepID=UPI003D7C53CE
MTSPPTSRRARLLAGVPLGVLLAVVVSLLGPLPTSQASITYLCTGYDRCKDEGYGHAGYKRAGHRMYWRMYSGHNCTNYAAYRMVKGGMDNERPWSGSGNAMYWGTEMRRITDDKPMVGAVAWWRANVSGAGSVGHVAYVEKVVSRRRIIVSEDSWGGDFGWKVVTRGGSGWPSGFIHFNDKAVRATTAPEIVGTPAVGDAVRVDVGRWTQDASVTVQWLAGGEPIAGATTKSFTPTLAERRKRLAVRVTGKARGYEAGVVKTALSPRVGRGTLTTDVAPTVSGTPRVDEVLQLRGGSISPSADSRAFRWYADGERIVGADGLRLRLTQEHIRSRITAAVVSRREGYHPLVVETEPTTPVAAGRFEVTSPFTLEGRPQRAHRLTVVPGTYTPDDAEVRYRWLRDGEAIPGATGTTYDATVDDVGHRLSVRVDLSRTGFRDRSVTVPAEGRVTTEPTLRVQTAGRPHRAVVRLRVAAPGVDHPGGEATVRVGRKSVTGDVVDGRLRAVVRGLGRGRHDVRVSYAGTSVVLPGRATTSVRVPRR